MIKGSCLCGVVQYRYMAALFESIICHCHDCRRAQGGCFAFNSPIKKQLFIVDQGKHALREYFMTAEKARVFCTHCGSPLYSYRMDLPEIIRLRLGTVTEGDIPAPKSQYFSHKRADFIEIKGAEEIEYCG